MAPLEAEGSQGAEHFQWFQLIGSDLMTQATLQMENNTAQMTQYSREHAAGRGAPVASLQGVVKKYGSFVALNGLDMELYGGEVVALLGPNGAGKTSTVRLLLGLTKPSAGSIQVFGRPPGDRIARMRTGAMLQVGAGAVPEQLTVREHIDLFRSYYPNPLPERDVIAIAGLEGIENRPYGKLSGGQKQRVLFGLALCGDPDLVFLDEPTVGLDVEARRGLWAQIRELSARGKTVLLTTHYLEEADELASRIVVLLNGKVITEGTSAEIKATHGVRTIRCQTTLADAVILSFPTVTAVRREGAVTIVEAREPDGVVRELIRNDAQLNGLEIASVPLEEAFLALTADTNRPAKD